MNDHETTDRDGNADSLRSLPNLYLADLGAGLELSPQTLRDAAYAIRRNREHWLVRQRTRTLVELLAYVGNQWLDPQSEYRIRALRDGVVDTGFGSATLARGLDAFFSSLTVEGLEGLIVQDLGDLKRLDAFSGSMPEMRTGRMSFARGPDLMGHFCAGNLPIPTLVSLVLGVLTKSAQFFKLPDRGGLIPRLFAHSLAQVEPKLGACLEFATWSRDRADLETALLEESDCVTVTGSDERVESLRRRLPARTRLVTYGHRVSFAYIAAEMLTVYGLKRLALDAATDVVAWNQLGCLSPHVIYVQEKGVITPEGFAEALAGQLARLESTEPRGELPPADAQTISATRTVYAMRRMSGGGGLDRQREESVFFESVTTVQLWQSENSTAWTVVLDTDPTFRASCLHRFVYIRPVKELATVLRYAEPVRTHLSTVALAAPDEEASAQALQLARWGATRICPLGRMQLPSLLWRHDGRPALGDLVTWVDWET